MILVMVWKLEAIEKRLIFELVIYEGILNLIRPHSWDFNYQNMFHWKLISKSSVNLVTLKLWDHINVATWSCTENRFAENFYMTNTNFFTDFLIFKACSVAWKFSIPWIFDNMCPTSSLFQVVRDSEDLTSLWPKWCRVRGVHLTLLVVQIIGHSLVEVLSF